jgi:hypothetical protein
VTRSAVADCDAWPTSWCGGVRGRGCSSARAVSAAPPAWRWLGLLLRLACHLRPMQPYSSTTDYSVVLQVLDSQPVPALRPGRLAEVAQLDSSTSDAAQCMAVRIS